MTENEQPAASHGKALVVSTGDAEAEAPDQAGPEAYSYHQVVRAFAPLLQRWGQVRYLSQAESRLDFALHECRRQNLPPLHLSFQPLHRSYLTGQAPNVVFPLWQFPDIPQEDLDNNPRHNWVRLAACADLVLTASSFTRDAFLRAGVQTPVQVIPVPVAPEYFQVPAWEPGQRVLLDGPWYVLPRGETPPPANPLWMAGWGRKLSLRERALERIKTFARRHLPDSLGLGLKHLYLVLRRARNSYLEETRIRYPDASAYPCASALELKGIVYTAVFNPLEVGQNWQDLLSAYLLALRDRDDALLVVQPAVTGRAMPLAVNRILQHYHELGIRHICKVALRAGDCSDAALRELARGSTYYLNTSQAEGACLPLQSFLAASRPAIAPVHTALGEYFSEELGLVVASHPEPCPWPHVQSRHCQTTWHRLVWQSLHDCLCESYQLASAQRQRYQTWAACARQRLSEHAGLGRVWPRLADALALASGPRSVRAGERRACAA
jgi:hypothetical protein